jgi:hypothetical protein
VGHLLIELLETLGFQISNPREFLLMGTFPWSPFTFDMLAVIGHPLEH